MAQPTSKPVVQTRLGKKHFESVDKLVDWIDETIQFWQPWEQPLADDYTNRRNSITQHLDAAKRAPNPEQADEQMQRGINALEAVIRDRSWIPHSDELASYAEAIRANHDMPIAKAAAQFIHGRNQTGDRNQFIGAVLALNAEFGVPDADAQRRALESVRDEFHAARLTAESLLGEMVEKKAELESETESALDNLRSNGKELLERIQSDAESLRGEHSDAMKEIKDDYRIKLALRTAVENFEDSAKSHRKESKRWGMISAVSGVLALVIVLGFGAFLHWKEGNTDIGRWSLAAVIALAATWALRLLTRNYVFHNRAAEDANERAVLVRTLLALLREDEFREGDVRAELLKEAMIRLFSRPGHDIDDANPLDSLRAAIKR